MRDKKQNKNNPVPQKENKINKEILKITYVFAGMFFLLLGYFVYFQVTQAADVVNNPYNKRQENFAKKIIRGKIISDDGEVLAYTDVNSNGDETRVYPYDNIFSHVIGVASHGKYGVELTNNFDLLTSNANPLEIMVNEFENEKSKGDNVLTTLDSKLQEYSYNALGNYDGAVVVLEPDTGKILSMVSKPDFNPNNISKIWDEINAEGNTDSVLVNRATQGLYTPGSIFKIFTTMAYIRENKDYDAYSFNCTGSVDFNLADGYRIKCFNNTVHGYETLEQAFANSCNGAFSTIGNGLDKAAFIKLSQEMLFNTDLPISLVSNKSRFGISGDSTIFDVTQSAIGQGTTVVTPMHMAMVVSAIANDGIMMKPYVVKKIEDYNGNKVKEFKPIKYKDLITKKEAALLQTYMKSVVTKGTAKVLNSELYDAAGKTGTAELDKNGRINSWFVGYAEKDGKKVAIAVVLENIPSGTGNATNVVKSIFDKYFSSNR